METFPRYCPLVFFLCFLFCQLHEDDLQDPDLLKELGDVSGGITFPADGNNSAGSSALSVGGESRGGGSASTAVRRRGSRGGGSGGRGRGAMGGGGGGGVDDSDDEVVLPDEMEDGDMDDLGDEDFDLGEIEDQLVNDDEV